MLGIVLSLEIILFTIVGGIGTVYGPAAGAVILYGAAEATRNMVGLSDYPNLHLIVYAAILIAVVIFLPEGLAGACQKLGRRGRALPSAAASPTAATSALAQAVTPASGEALLRARGVSKRFGGLLALSGITLELGRGECLGLIGLKGSGKSTLINVIAGFYKPDAGEVLLGQRVISGSHPEDICRLGIGRTHQIAQPFGDLTALENVMVGAYARTRESRKAREIAHALLERLGLGHLADLRVRHLTTANRKKIELARALATGAQVVLLDEALAGLTEQETEEMIRILLSLRRQGISLIVVEHIMRVVTALCDRVVFLNFGQIVAEGRPQDVLREPQVVRIYLGGEDHDALAVGG